MTRQIRFLSAKNSTATSPPTSKSALAEPPDTVSAESDFVVLLAALLCALISVVGLIAVARCAWLRRGSANSGRSSGHPSANKGLKKKIVQSLPKYTYDSSSGSGGGTASAADCAICLAEYVDGDEIRMLPQCGHRFHVQCIDTWLGSHSSCPSCRQILVVARCQKCGEFPAVSGVGVQVTVPAGSHSTSRPDCAMASTSNTYHESEN